MKGSKYLGKVYEGRWKVVGCIYPNGLHNQKYVLKNIYNEREIIISPKALARVEQGETTISRVISHKIWGSNYAKRN